AIAVHVAHADRRVVRDVAPAALVAPRDHGRRRAPPAVLGAPAAHAAVAARAQVGAAIAVHVGRGPRRVGARLLLEERDLADVAVVDGAVAVVVPAVADLDRRGAARAARVGHTLVDPPVAVVVAPVADLGGRTAVAAVVDHVHEAG